MIFKFYLLDHLGKYLEPILHFFSIYQIVFLQPKKKKKKENWWCAIVQFFKIMLRLNF